MTVNSQRAFPRRSELRAKRASSSQSSSAVARELTPSEMNEAIKVAMGRALYLADRARANGDVPVGAVVLDEAGKIIGEGWNTREIDRDPAGHAEMMALRNAAKKVGSWRLDSATMVVTLEPCTMCAGAIVLSRLRRLVFGAWDEKAGACGSVRDVVRDSRLNHQVEVISGVLADECAVQLRGFFSTRRNM